MISSCAECTTKCCRSGPGPYKAVSMSDWLSAKQTGSDRYNTKCEHFKEDTGMCGIWPNTPLICKTYVCGVRTFTRAELRRIDKLLEKK